jgi:hypothetical protein
MAMAHPARIHGRSQLAESRSPSSAVLHRAASAGKIPRRGELEMGNDAALRNHLVELLEGRKAHVDFDRAIAVLPAKLRGAKGKGLDFTPWRLLEHLRIAQRDILEFCRDPEHVSPAWPAGYWPAADTPPSARAWEKSVTAFRRDLTAMKKLVKNSKTDLFARISGGTGQTILREAMLVADHNAYHLGQLVMLRRLLGAWPEGK